MAFGEAEGLLRTARATLRTWETASVDGGAEEAVKIRRLLGRIQQAVDDLENDLISLEMDGKVTDKEAQRRKQHLAQLSSDRKAVAAQLAEGPNVQARPHVAVNLSASEVRVMQGVQEREQDALLEDLGTSLRRQQAIGSGMKKEVEEQQVRGIEEERRREEEERRMRRQKRSQKHRMRCCVRCIGSDLHPQPLLDRLGHRTERSKDKVDRETARIQEFEVGKCSIMMWIVGKKNGL